MGAIAARKAREILDNTIKVLAIELICAPQALEFRKPLKGGVGNSAADLIKSGKLIKEVEKVVKLEG